MTTVRVVGRFRWVLATVVLVASLVLVLGWTSPRTVPRLSVFPAPQSRNWHDGCNYRFAGWQRSGLIWTATYGGTLMGCPKGPTS